MYGYGGKLVIQSGGSLKSSTLMQTGQTTVYRTGDDADTKGEGRATDFFTLDQIPVHSNGSATANTTTARFTDELGGATYTNNWVIDWSTYDNVANTVLGIYRVENGVNINWNDSIDAALGTFGTFAGCRLPNCKEIMNFFYYEINPRMNYTPFSILTGFLFWTSTTNKNTTTAAYVCNNSTGNVASTAKTTVTNCRYLPVRTFTVTGTTLT